MHELILHHYDPSPFSEKIRLIFGLKNLHWQSVIVPMVLPKPDLMPLTGGNRRTPVLQIGANIFCGTGLIAFELEQRFPEPSIYPGCSWGLCEIISLWADEVLFGPSSRYAIRDATDFPSNFHEDRASMRGLTPPPPEQLRRDAPHNLEQLQLNLVFLEATLGTGREFILGNDVSIADFAIYARIWWAQLNAGDQDELSALPQVQAWMRRISALGHGERTESTPSEALDIAKAALPFTPDSDDKSLTADIGDYISLGVDGVGSDPVQGRIVAVTDNAVVLRRVDEQVGDIHVHLPRRGYKASDIL